MAEFCFYCCISLCEVTFESDSKLKCAIKSIGIPSNVEVVGEECFSSCKSLCEVTFESDSKLRESQKDAFDEFLRCVKVPVGFAVEYKWPRNCRIKYYNSPVASERKK
jgi:hypothetical protein